MAKITIADYSGGLATSRLSGSQGSYAFGNNLDIHSEPGILQAGQALVQDSDATVDGLILWMIIDESDGNVYAGDDQGKIYSRTPGGVWALEINLGSRICGLIKYEGNFYAATSDTLYRAATVAGLVSYQTWTGDEIDADYHPMYVGDNNFLYVGAGRFVSQVDINDVFTSDALELPTGFRVRALTTHDVNIWVGCWKGKDANVGKVFPWDGLTETFFTPINLEGSCNALLSINGIVYCSAGNRGNFYFVSNGRAEPVHQLPGDYTDINKMNIQPDALSNLGPLIMIGSSEFTPGLDPTELGIYSFGAKNFHYRQVMNLEYSISSGSLQGINIGSLLKIGEDLLVSWEDNGTYGVDFVDYGTKFDQAIYESIVLVEGFPEKVVREIELTFAPLPASCQIEARFKTQDDATWQIFEDSVGTNIGIEATTGVTDMQIPLGHGLDEVRSFELQITLTTNLNDTPKIRTITTDLYVKRDRE